MQGLTINEAADLTGWSARMLRYVEQAGLIALPRSAGGYRLFGPGELQRLRTLKDLLERFEIALSDVAFARRLESDVELREWLTSEALRPEHVEPGDWLRFEQDKHQRLLASA
jgi:MerR family copper efflux transcriptional regulator